MKVFLVMIPFYLLVSGCATIVRGSSDEVLINSDPDEAGVTISNGMFCRTPCNIELKRKSDLIVKIEKEGYKTVRTALISTMDGASLGIGTAANFLFFPVVNDVVDYSTRANYSLKPNPLFVRLISEDSEQEYEFTKQSDDAGE